MYKTFGVDFLDSQKSDPIIFLIELWVRETSTRRIATLPVAIPVGRVQSCRRGLWK